MAACTATELFKSLVWHQEAQTRNNQCKKHADRLTNRELSWTWWTWTGVNALEF